MTRSGLTTLLAVGALALAACQPATKEDVQLLTEKQNEILAKLQQLEAKVQAPARPAGPAPEDYSKVYDIKVAGSPVLGDPDAPVTLVEFSDFQCPFCARAIPDIKQLQAKYPDKLKVVFKHFPLSFHPEARPTAIASMAAQDAGCFWEFHDKAFDETNKQTLSGAKAGDYAQAAGCDSGKFKQALEQNKANYDQRITKEMSEGQSADVRGTPTLYINGRKVRDRSMAGMSSMVEEELAKSGAS